MVCFPGLKHADGTLSYFAYKGDQILSKSDEDTKHVSLQFLTRQDFKDNSCLRLRPVRSYNGKMGKQPLDECASSPDILR